MKQSIQLRLGQHLTMTPQLQQAIRLLQLSTVELRMEVQQALESNLMLEPVEEDTADDEGPIGGDDAGSMDSYDRGDGEGQRELDTATSSVEGIPEELPVDGAWDDIYDGGVPYTAATSGDSNGQDFFENQGTTTESLRDHLLWQMGLTPFSETDMMIAITIIDSVGEDGYLALPLEEVHRSLPAELDVDLEEVEAVLHRIQRFDPVGVAARSASECLLIQLQQFDEDTPWRQQAETLVEHYLDLLANRDYVQLMKRMKLSESELQQVIQLIQSLDPHPGSRITTETPEYIIPDVFVSKQKGTWRVELNPDAAPKLRINPYYASLARQSGNKEDNNYLKNHLQEARWFLKSLQSRNETLLKVATCIVEHQRGFLEKGDEAMQPLVLRDVAEAIDMHESTISRVTTQKYMYTPRGIYEFKYFFSSHVGTADGGECSATAIRAMIKKLVSSETPGRPLSDSAIAGMLEKQGINVARRTVTKYREAMSIPPSNKRRRLAW